MDSKKILVLAEVFEALAGKKKKPWSTKPKGWKDPKSIKKYHRTMTGKSKHPFTTCVNKMKGNIDNPEGFCASVKDKAEGKGWRKGPKKKKK